MEKQGYMIAVEGADKAGKHTQVMNMVNYLRSQGISTETLDFPQYNSYFGGFIKDYLNGKFGQIRNLPAEYTMLPYALDRLQHQPQIKQWLQDGKWVVLDRYTYSNAFSIAKTPVQQWADRINFLEDLEFRQLGIIKPDWNIYLYLDPEMSFNMRNQGLKAYQNGKPDIHESDLKLLQDVSDVYLKIATSRRNWAFVDETKPDGARMTINEVFDKIKPILDMLITKNR